MKTGKAIMQHSDALTAVKYLLLVELAFIGGRDAVQSVPNLLVVATLKVRNLEALPVLSGNAILIVCLDSRVTVWQNIRGRVNQC